MSYENYAGRVNYAAAVIIAGRRTTRGFDNCFEMYDGDEVAVALYRRAENNPKLKANLFRYINEGTVTAAVARLANVKNLAASARATRARRSAEFAIWLEQNQVQ